MSDRSKRKYSSANPKPSENRTVRIDLDELDDDQQEMVPEIIEKATGLSIFEGTIEHGYTIEHVEDTHICPRCQDDTENLYAHYLYSTDAGVRVMTATAGHFCVDCPTVIIDEDFIEKGMIGNYRFQGVVGMSHDGIDSYPFQTWNGKKPVYLFDEEQDLLGIASEGDSGTRGMIKRKPRKARGKLPRKTQTAKKNQRKKSRKRK